MRAIWFDAAPQITELQERREETLSLAFIPTIDVYNGGDSVQLNIKDLQWESERLLEEARRS